MTDLLDQALTAAVAKGAGREPATPKDIALAERSRAMPDELRRLYLASDGLQLGAVEVFDLDDYADVNGQEDLSQELPGAVFFGSDRADGFVFIDVAGSLGLGDGSVLWTDRSELSVDEAVPCADGLARFLSAVLRGDRPWTGRSIGQRATERLAQTIAAHPDRVDARPGLSDGEVGRICRERGLPAPFGLGDLVRVANGLRIVGSGQELIPIEAMSIAEGSDEGAIWVGSAPDGVRFAVTRPGWRGLPADRLIAVPPGGDIEQGVNLGRLAEVVANWIVAEATP